MSLRQRDPRQADHAYMGAIAKLCCVPCLVLGPVMTRQVQVCHLRAESIEHGKRATGMAERPDDRWTLPMCMPHHQGDSRKTRLSQHTMNEEAFWAELHIDPFAACMALSDAYDAGQPMLPVLVKICAAARKEKFG